MIVGAENKPISHFKGFGIVTSSRELRYSSTKQQLLNSYCEKRFGNRTYNSTKRVCVGVCVSVCVHELQSVCVCNKACHAVFCFPTLFISSVIIFPFLISLIMRGARSVGTAACLRVLTKYVCLFCMQSVKREKAVFVLYF